ncbi:3 beta-hydroxysteroid dehydrogenase/Delta 5--_4-isomerase type 1 [Stomoxys calcitrans]|uniref:3 beta-hydroxysteroid dehydrogenase/Delta 5-->4-isomerase type 1 n=1 Tax=Stomoxys calcitrans TaxID=35570 RepID=UPI0027E33C3E|nr:3 beta-hydroxysteroid dehydrogenase/Delta 5-->4-isomerase type 1 [Stomoxys calcitrans]
MANESGDVVLVTGGSGFIGQHIIRLLFENKSELNIREIRSVDLKTYKNTIDDEQRDLRTFVGDLCEPESVVDAFKGADSVFHCAGMMSLQFPPNYGKLNRNNIEGTQSVVDLCVKHNVKHLVYTSCGSVCFVPFKGTHTAVIINQTETKAPTPVYKDQDHMEFDRQFILRGYSSSKLRAEQIVLAAHGRALSNGNGTLVTTAIRPPLTYGEGDNFFVTDMLKYLSSHSFVYPRIAGVGGKQQLCYAGNVAWGHICAYKSLKSAPRAIGGLPVFITDETSIADTSRFLQKIGASSEKFKVRQSSWYIPRAIFQFFAMLLELLIIVLEPVKKITMKYSLRALCAYASSMIFFNRLRAAIHIDYVPLIEEQTAIKKSVQWYIKWYEQNIPQRNGGGAKRKNH